LIAVRAFENLDALDYGLFAVAVAGTILLLVTGIVLSNLFRVVSSLKSMVDGIKDETVPLIGEVGNTVKGVNKEIERVDAIVGSVQNIAKNAETVSTTLKTAVTNPLVKGLAFLFGAQRAVGKFRGED
jgi:uncharacterized protein YoxC